MKNCSFSRIDFIHTNYACILNVVANLLFIDDLIMFYIKLLCHQNHPWYRNILCCKFYESISSTVNNNSLTLNN